MEVIRGYQVIPFDQAAAELAGRIAGDLERVGRPIGVADPMIAAIAIRTAWSWSRAIPAISNAFNNSVIP